MPIRLAMSDAPLPQPVPSLAVLPSSINPPQAIASCVNTKKVVHPEGNGSPGGFFKPRKRLAPVRTSSQQERSDGEPVPALGTRQVDLGQLERRHLQGLSHGFPSLDVADGGRIAQEGGGVAAQFPHPPAQLSLPFAQRGRKFAQKQAPRWDSSSVIVRFAGKSAQRAEHPARFFFPREVVHLCSVLGTVLFVRFTQRAAQKV